MIFGFSLLKLLNFEPFFVDLEKKENFLKEKSLLEVETINHLKKNPNINPLFC